MAFNMTSTDSFEIELNENFNKMFETDEPNVTSNNDYNNGNAISSSINVNSSANTNITMNSADISISTNNSSSSDSINGLNIGVGGGMVNGGGLLDLGTGFDPTDGSLEGSDNLLSDDENQDCKICNNKLITPRVLSCLHVFCESCLSTLLNTNTGDINKFSDVGGVIVCPKCEQTTKVGFKGLTSLHCDYIKTNILDFSRVKPDAIPCTACTVTEKAISRCNDCANFLCSGCDKAHKCMRCFENHEVVIIDEKTEHVAMHKILYCTTHTSQSLKYYCFNCQVPICNDCLIADHKGVEHHYEVIFDAEKRIRIELIESIQNAQAKIKEYDVISNGLNNSLTDLQNQHDAAKQLIEVTCENFKKNIDKLYENALNNLEKLHSERELKTMDCFHKVENSVNKIVNACTFTERVLKKANGPELLSLTRIIGKQFLNLNNLQKFNLNYSIEFQPKYDKFEEISDSYFGKIVTESSINSKERTPPSSLPGMPPIINKTNGNCNNSSGTLTNSITASSPISLPTSMQSSFDGDMTFGKAFILPNLTAESSQAMNSMQMAVAPSVTSGTSSDATLIGPSTIPGLSSMAEYNLHRLANLAADTNDISNNFVSANPSPTQYTLADLIKGDPRAFNNFQAIAKYNMNSTTINGLNGLQGMNGINDLTDNSLLTRVSSIDNVNSLLNVNDFSMPNGNQTTDDFGLSIPRNNITNGRPKPTPMQIRCKFGSLGASKGQFNAPHGFCLGVEEEIIVADTSNHRIEVFEKNGTFKFQFGVPGKEEGQLWYPRKVAVMRTNHKFVVCDRGNERSRMQLFTKNGHFIKKIAIRYIDIVAGLAVTSSGHIVAVDSVSPTVFIINEEGDLVHWFDCSDYMREPSDIAIIGSNFYICDFKGHCVAVFKENGTFLYRIGHEKITCFPNGIDISDAGDILIGDSHGNRFHVACFSRDGILQSEFECPYVKVSRCCGLKITSEGYVVTLAKNNHHVLVLNTLYIH